MEDQYATDTDFADIFTRIRDGETVAGYSIREGYLMRNTMLCVTQPLRQKIIEGDKSTGLKLYDPGYLNTAPVRSSISYIDGDKGMLRYRGYPIEELAERSTYPEVAYLLTYGNLPTKEELSQWETTILQHSALPEGVLSVIAALPHDVHPMSALITSISALGAFHPDANPALRGQDLYKSRAVRDKQIVRILGKCYTGVWLRHYIPESARAAHTSSEEKFGEISISNATKRRRAGLLS
ncbi:hypothetical protein L7F22_062056 [Adiantum nelumboides]|nr:hypothetical protein [Adiantum nelumboides]